MYLKVVAVVIAVRHAVAAERNIPYNDVELIVRECRILEALDLHVRLRIQLRRDPAREVVQLHAVQPRALRDLFGHISEEIARTHGRLQDTVVALYPEPLERGVDAADDVLRRVVGIERT